MALNWDRTDVSDKNWQQLLNPENIGNKNFFTMEVGFIACELHGDSPQLPSVTPDNADDIALEMLMNRLDDNGTSLLSSAQIDHLIENVHYHIGYKFWLD